MANSKRDSRVAYLEEADEDSNSSVEGIEGTRKYANKSEASTIKEQPKTGKSRSDKRPSSPKTSGSNSPTVNFVEPEIRRRSSQRDTEDDSPRSSIESAGRERDLRHQRDREQGREERREIRRKEDEKARHRRAELVAEKSREHRREANLQQGKKTRPVVRHAATQPVVQQSSYRRGQMAEDPAAYGIPQPMTSHPRPRAQPRPKSYTDDIASRPPMANMGWHPPPPHSNMPPPPGAFPHPQMYTGVGPPMPGYGGPPASSVGPPPGYYDAPLNDPQHQLKHHFDIRSSSAMGRHGQWDTGESRLSRRPSQSRKVDEERRMMPPPDRLPIRSQTTAVTSTPFRPPPTQSQRPMVRRVVSRAPSQNRRSVDMTDEMRREDNDYHHDLFQDSPESSYDQRRTALVRRTRRGSVLYPEHAYDMVPADGRRERRASVYGAGNLGFRGVSSADKYLAAEQYQDYYGGKPMPLTAETLKKARGGGASSRSTRSSGSRDDSEYKRSNTTGITRSSSGNNENVTTVKVSGGQAVVRLANSTEIQCDEGGEITISNRLGDSRSSSDQGTIYAIEDSRSRVDRKALPHRTRAPSQSDSQSRGYIGYHAPYEPVFSQDNNFF